MLEFSRLCLGQLSNHLPLKIFLSLFQHFLDANVLKEIEKDQMIIAHAAATFDKGEDNAEVDVNDIFEMTKKVDEKFVKKLGTPLLSVRIRYDDFAEIRKRRIAFLQDAVFRLFGNWEEEISFPDLVQVTYTEKGFQEFLGEVLHLYNLETKMLSNSIAFHGPAARLKELFAGKLFAAMERAAGEIAVEYTRRIYVDKGCSCPNQI